MGQSPNTALMTGQRRKRWVNIETVLGKWHVFAGVSPPELGSIPFYQFQIPFQFLFINS